MPDLEPGALVGHYRIVRKLGSGGMADVYEAEDDKLGRRVALKILPPELERSPGLIARFETEVRAAAKLSHRNIVTVFEVGHEGGYHYYAMRLLTGGDLRDRIKRGMSPAEAIAILRELAEAFSEAHGAGFVHRDVKPENVVFDERGLPVLTDFGIAKVLGSSTGATATGATIGTPKYMSPEQARAKPVDARTDLYSLGIVFYEMLTGKPPFESEEAIALIMAHVSEPTPRLPPELAMLQPLVDKLTAKEANDRPASAQALIDLIDALPPMPSASPDADAMRKSRAASARRTLEDSALRVPTPVKPLPPPPSVSVAPTVVAPTIAAAPETKRATLVLPIVVVGLVLVIGAGALTYLMWPKPSPPPVVVAPPLVPVETAKPEPKPEPPKTESPPVEPPPAPVEQAKPTPIEPGPAKPEVAKPEPAKPAAEPPNRAAARKMIAEARAAFGRKEYKSCISYANSALILDPGNAEAKKLLKQSEDAREAAMKAIKVD